MDKPLHLPGVTKFHELFVRATPVKDLSVPSDTAYTWKIGSDWGKVTLSSRVRIESRKGLEFVDVVPTEQLTRAIESSMIMSAGYSFCINIIVQGTTALVLVKYDQILGSRHMSNIESRTIGLTEQEYDGVEALVLTYKDAGVRIHRGTRKELLIKWRKMDFGEQRDARANYDHYKEHGISLTGIVRRARDVGHIRNVIDS